MSYRAQQSVSIEELAMRSRHRYGKWDASRLMAVDQSIRDAYESRDRVEVTWTGAHDDFVRTGVVSVTTGWRPAFLLIRRSSDVGSSDVLGPNDKVTAVRRGRKYVPVAKLEV